MQANINALDPYPNHKPHNDIYLTPKIYDVGKEIRIRHKSDDTDATAYAPTALIVPDN